MRHFTVLLVILSAWGVRSVSAQIGGPYSISGTVTTERGKPVKGARVEAWKVVGDFVEGCVSLDDFPNVSHSETDDAGHFLMDVSPFCGRGQYAVHASKEKEGYPDVCSDLYSGPKMIQLVSLTPPTNTATVAIRLGPKAGTLFGWVTDAVTGALLDPCAELALVKEPDNLLTGRGIVRPRYKVLIPPGTEVKMEVWEEGYKTWYYPGTQNQSTSKPLRLASGQSKKLDIRLEPDRNANEGSCPPSEPEPWPPGREHHGKSSITRF